jgi:hypothetical protein
VVAWVQIVLVLTWAVTGTVLTTISCRPVSYFWTRVLPEPQEGAYCTDQLPVHATCAIISVVADIAILLLPTYLVSRLQLNRRKKTAVTAVFFLGSLYVYLISQDSSVTSYLEWRGTRANGGARRACAASGLRLNSIFEFNYARADTSYSQAVMGTWIAIEIHVAILCANLPCLTPLLEPWLRGKNIPLYGDFSNRGEESNRARGSKWRVQGNEDAGDCSLVSDSVIGNTSSRVSSPGDIEMEDTNRLV